MNSRANAVPREEAALEFLKILHHAQSAEKPGYIVGLAKSGDEVRSFGSKKAKEIASWSGGGLESPSLYATVNEFTCARRRSSSLYCLCAMYIDMDGHSLPAGELKKAVNTAEASVSAAVERGALPAPTMVTRTGRGLGLYYVLARSVNAKQSAMARYFWKVYAGLAEACEREAEGGLSVDKSVADATRVCRLPGTYNAAGGAYCELAEGERKFYTLGELGAFAFSGKERVKGRAHEGVRAAFRCAPNGRAKALAKVAAMKISAGIEEGWRNELLFQYYNACAASLGAEAAKEAAVALNESLPRPIRARELEATFRSVDGAEGYDGVSGHYAMSARKAAERLGLSDEEAARSGLTTSARQRAREATAEAKASRDKIALGALKAFGRKRGLEEANGELLAAGLRKISMRTLDRIAARERESFLYEEKKAALKALPKNAAIHMCECVKEAASAVERSLAEAELPVSLAAVSAMCTDKRCAAAVEAFPKALGLLKGKPESFRAKVAAGANWLAKEYLARLSSGKYPELCPEMLAYDLDALFRSAQEGSCSVGLRGEKIPERVFLKGEELRIAKGKRTRREVASAPNAEEAKWARKADAIEKYHSRMEALGGSRFAELLDEASERSSEASRFRWELYKAWPKALDRVVRAYEHSGFDLHKICEEAFGVELSCLSLPERVPSRAQKEAGKAYRERLSKFEALRNPSACAGFEGAAKTFLSLYSECKRRPSAVLKSSLGAEGVTGAQLKAALFKMSLSDVEGAEGLSRREAAARWVGLAKSRGWL